MDAQRAAQELTVIRQLMERPIKYSVVSGLSAILAGLAALAGVICDYHISRYYPPKDAFWMNMVVWACVFIYAVGAVIAVTRVREIRQGLPMWSSAKTRVLRTILPPFLAGMGLTFAIAARWYTNYGVNEWGLIPSIWMCCYGLACWQMGEFSSRELRWMGVAFLAASAVAACDQSYPYMALGVTFGGFHLCYGVIVWMRHGG